MSRLDSATRLQTKVGRPPHRHATFPCQQRSQAFANEILHHDIRCSVGKDAKVDGGGDVFVLERSGGLSLTMKPGQDLASVGEVGTKELDGESSLDHDVLRFIDHAHSPLCEDAQDAVLAPHHLADPTLLGTGAHRPPSPWSWLRSAPRVPAVVTENIQARVSSCGSRCAPPAADPRAPDIPAVESQPASTSYHAQSSSCCVPPSPARP